MSSVRLLFSLLVILTVSCQQRADQIPEPNYDPYLLKPGKSFPARMIPINMDTVAPPERLPAQAETITLGEPQVYPEYTNYHPAGKPKYVPTQIRKLDMSQFDPPAYYPSQGKKVAATWPEWTPAQLSYSKGTPFHFAYMGVEQGLHSNRIHDLIEDRQGRIWIGTGDGVSVYDGSGLMHFSSAQGLLGGNVRCVLEDSKGRIWLGTMGGLSVWDGTGFTHFTKEDGFQDANVWNNTLMEDSRGHIWVGTWDGGLSVWDEEGFYHYSTAQGLSSNRIRGIMEDNQGRIWISYGVGEINILDPTQDGQLWVFSIYEGANSNFAAGVIQDQEGKFWMATPKGLMVWDSKKDGQLTHYTTAEGLSSNNIQKLMTDRHGNVWVSTSDGGVNMWDGKGFYHYTESEGLAGNSSINTLLEDQRGRIWAGSFKSGLSIWLPPSEKPFFRPNPAVDLSSYYPRDRLLENNDGKVWIGTKDNGVLIWDSSKGGQFSQYRSKEGLKTDDITGLTADAKGRVWFGKGGFYSWSPSNDRQLALFPLPNNFELLDIAEDREGHIWAGYNAHGLSVWDGKKILRYMPQQGLAHHGITDLAADRQGRIWMSGWAFDGDITMWDGEGFNHLSVDVKPPRHVTNEIIENSKGHIWFATFGSGIGIWDEQEYFHYTTAEGLISNATLGLFQDREGDIWVGTDQGLNHLQATETPHTWKIESLDHRDGLGEVNITDVLVDREDQIWMLGTKGLGRMQLDRAHRDTTRPRLRILDLQPFFADLDWRQMQAAQEAGTAPILQDQGISLSGVAFDSVRAFTNLPIDPVFPHNINQLSLRWECIHWLAPHKLQYSYFLEGQDRGWSPLVKENKITYQDLQPGKYTFRIRAVGANSEWSETASYSFQILPPWWQSKLAYGLYLLLLAGLVWGVIRWRVSYLRLHYEREAALAAEASAREASEAKSAFLSTVSHELRTPLTSIIGFTKLNRKNLENKVLPEIKKEATKAQKSAQRIVGNLNIVESEGERLTHLINELLDLAKIESGQMEWKMEALQPADLIVQAVNATSALFEQKPSLKLITEVPDDLPMITGDRDRLLQVLINLISNAVKFTDEGEVRLAVNIPAPTSRAPFKGGFAHSPGTAGAPLKGRGHEAGDVSAVLFSVSDTGSGIPPEHLDKVFARFKQVEDNQKGKPKGTGLGLPICKEIVEHHEGKIWVESEVGKGSTFAFTLSA
jgi:signal transduction histidine kinase/streptogramin lyase